MTELPADWTSSVPFGMLPVGRDSFMDANSLSAKQLHSEHGTTAGFLALTIGSVGVV